jgi:hypothetical protein
LGSSNFTVRGLGLGAFNNNIELNGAAGAADAINSAEALNTRLREKLARRPEENAEIDDLIHADLRYRDKQLLKLKDEVLDLEDRWLPAKQKWLEWGTCRAPGLF